MAEKHGIVELVTGAVVILVAAAFLIYAITHSGRISVSGYPLQARFDRIDGLAIGADVRIAGVKVGSVTDAKIDTKDFTALVALTVRSDLRIPRDSSAEITSEGLLGGKYVSISPGGDDATLQPGQTISITQSSISLEQLLGKFIFNLSNTPKPEEAASPAGGASKK
jgi:phospholipid/cholesterol/gamma-HCH transport system substrate-binding protein